MARLPLNFESGVDLVSDPLIQLLAREGSFDELAATQSTETSIRNSVLIKSAVEQQTDRATDGLRVRASQREPGPCITVYRRT